MNSLKFLELQRLIKELQFVESDYLYRQEVIKQSDQVFQESVDKILIQYPELKKLWNEQHTPIQDTQEQQSYNQEVEEKVEELDMSVKQLYRDIVKATHPDKIKNKKLNELYLEATSAYESNDLVTIYRLCNDLMIQVDFNEEIINKISDKIKEYKTQITFLESTYTFQWIKSNDTDKLKIVLKYIENKIK
jgi:hypothetical protein